MACHFTVPERGGLKGWIGVAEEVSDISLACRQIGPIRFKAKFEQGEDVFRQRRSLFFKKMQIVRGCDVKRNVLVYMVYSDRLIEGSPKNSTSSVPIMPWGAGDQVQRCARFRGEVAHHPKSSFARASPGETCRSISRAGQAHHFFAWYFPSRAHAASQVLIGFQLSIFQSVPQGPGPSMCQILQSP